MASAPIAAVVPYPVTAAGVTAASAADPARYGAGPGPDTLGTLARALDGLFAVLVGTLEPATGVIVPIVYW
jgi:hypothetical protein